jgi:hypothetical protein
MLKFYDIFCASVANLCRLLSKRHQHSTNKIFFEPKKKRHGYFMKFPPFLNMFSPHDKTSAK